MDLEIYDCTLREGEQQEGVSYSTEDRLEFVKMLDEFGVNYIELGWPFASKEIFDSIKKANEIVNKAKIVAFGSTSIKENVKEDNNLNSIIDCGAKYACIFGKTSTEHIEKQLKLTGEENINKIIDSIAYLKSKDVKVFYDAEHYFDGYKDNPYYAIRTIIAAIEGGADRIILCDTNGGVVPTEVEKIVRETYETLKRKGFKTNLGVHFHNDSGLALANTLTSLPYIKQVQGTINGIGERVGNLDFSKFLPVYMIKLGNELEINLKELKHVNDKAYILSGLEIPQKKAYVGNLAFAHKAGVHIDAIKKGATYEHLNPEELGNKRLLILNTMGGRSAVINIASKFGIELDKSNPDIINKINKLYEELKLYENYGYNLGTLKAEQFLIINKYFGNKKDVFKILSWEINSKYIEGKELTSYKVRCKLGDEVCEDSLTIDGGPVDCAFKTIKKILSKKYPEVYNIKLVDFHVSIAIKKKEESAVRTKINFKDGENIETVGVDKNILESSIEAIEKAFRYYLMNHKEEEEI